MIGIGLGVRKIAAPNQIDTRRRAVFLPQRPGAGIARIIAVGDIGTVGVENPQIERL